MFVPQSDAWARRQNRSRWPDAAQRSTASSKSCGLIPQSILKRRPSKSLADESVACGPISTMVWSHRSLARAWETRPVRRPHQACRRADATCGPGFVPASYPRTPSASIVWIVSLSTVASLSVDSRLLSVQTSIRRVAWPRAAQRANCRSALRRKVTQCHPSQTASSSQEEDRMHDIPNPIPASSSPLTLFRRKLPANGGLLQFR